jgi:probable HAF family extracellular repeat protein
LRLLPRLLAGVAIATWAGTAHGQLENETPTARPASPLYSVVNLGAGDLSELPAINTKDQVSFSLQTAQGSRGYFFDGKKVRDIGTLGGPATNAVGLNNAGQVTGATTVGSGSQRAFVWKAGADMTDLGLLPGAYESAAAAINNLGVVTGYSHGVPSTSPRAFRWSAADGIQDLGAFTGGMGSFSAGSSLNDAGLIAGNSDVSASDRHAFAWTRARGMVDIDTLRSGNSLPVAVGGAGQVAGHYVVPKSDNLYHAFLWTADNGMRDIGTAGAVESFVLAMSPNAHIAGVINLARGDQHAMSWTQAGGMADLGTLDGGKPGAASRALYVNSKGQIVGWSRSKVGEMKPFLWSAGSGMVDLSKRLYKAPAGLKVDEALAISDNGVIVAGSNAGLVLLTPYTGSGAYTVGPVAAPDLVEVGKPLDASVSFASDDTVGIGSVSWSWGDGAAAQAGALKEERGAGSATASHRYTAPGIYPVTATVLNRAGQSVTVSRQVVAYAPGGAGDMVGGIVGGNGAILSPQGALKTAPTKACKASFRFIVPSSTGASATAAGQGQLEFGLAGWIFRSDNLQPTAEGQFEGSGTVNGRGDYRFAMATMPGTLGVNGTGGTKGGFNLKVWHIDPQTKAPVVIYDNLMGGATTAEGGVTEGYILQR